MGPWPVHLIQPGLASPFPYSGRRPKLQGEYPQGKFDQGGPAQFEALLKNHNFNNFKIFAGFIPDTLDDFMRM